MQGIRKNKGFSLIEMIVVMAISAILLGLAAISLSMIARANVTKAGNSLSTAMTNARMTSMAKGTDAGALTISRTGGNIYIQIGEKEPTLLCSDAVQIYYTDSHDDALRGNMTGSVELVEGASWTLEYDISGAIKSFTDGSDNMGRLLVRDRGGNRGIEIFFYKETGKHMRYAIL